MPAKNRTHIKIPVELKARLDCEAAKRERLAADGVIQVPDGVDLDRGFPLWLVISQLLDDKEAHRARSNRKRRSAGAGLTPAGCGGGVAS